MYYHTHTNIIFFKDLVSRKDRRGRRKENRGEGGERRTGEQGRNFSIGKQSHLNSYPMPDTMPKKQHKTVKYARACPGRGVAGFLK